LAESANYPRVLVIAVNPISRVQSNGLMMRSFFEGWPRDRLAQIYFPFFHRFPPDASVCDKYLRVNPLGIAKEQTLLPDGRATRARASRLVTTARMLARSPKFRTRFVDPVREILAASPWLDREVLRYSRSFKPDVVYSLLGTLGTTRAAALVAQDLNCPVVPHFTDHWIETRFVGSPFESYFRRQLQLWLNRVIERSPVLLTMSRAMAEEYARRFPREAVSLTTLVEQAPYLRAECGPENNPSTLRLVYAGNLGLKRWTVLKHLGIVLEKLKVEGIESRLEIYCSEEDRRQYQREIAVPGIIDLKEWVAPSQLPELLTEADVLVHVESPDSSLLHYTRFSFSTKLSHYMMAGRCLLLVGPSDAGSMQEVREMGGGVVVSPTTPGALEQAVREVLTDHSFRREMGNKARKLALVHFEGTGQRARFRRILSAAAAQSTDRP